MAARRFLWGDGDRAGGCTGLMLQRGQCSRSCALLRAIVMPLITSSTRGSVRATLRSPVRRSVARRGEADPNPEPATTLLALREPRLPADS